MYGQIFLSESKIQISYGHTEFLIHIIFRSQENIKKNVAINKCVLFLQFLCYHRLFSATLNSDFFPLSNGHDVF